MSIWRPERSHFKCYTDIEVLNTIVGFAAIFILTGTGASPYAANIAGYVAILLLNFFASKKFTSSNERSIKHERYCYLLIFTAGWLLNLVMLKFALSRFGRNVFRSRFAATTFRLQYLHTAAD